MGSIRIIDNSCKFILYVTISSYIIGRSKQLKRIMRIWRMTNERTVKPYGIPPKRQGS